MVNSVRNMVCHVKPRLSSPVTIFKCKKRLKNCIRYCYWHHFCFDLFQNSNLYSKCISACVLSIYPWKFYEIGLLVNGWRRFVLLSRVLDQTEIAIFWGLSSGQGTTISRAFFSNAIVLWGIFSSQTQNSMQTRCLVFEFIFLQLEQHSMSCTPFLYQSVKTMLFIVRRLLWHRTMQKIYFFPRISSSYVCRSPASPPHLHPKIQTICWQGLIARL